MILIIMFVIIEHTCDRKENVCCIRSVHTTLEDANQHAFAYIQKQMYEDYGEVPMKPTEPRNVDFRHLPEDEREEEFDNASKIYTDALNEWNKCDYPNITYYDNFVSSNVYFTGSVGCYTMFEKGDDDDDYNYVMVIIELPKVQN